MAVKNAPQKPDVLIVDKIEFKNKLLERIEKGKELLEKPFKDVSQKLEDYEHEYNKWTNYNLEYLKHSFNNIENSYIHEYQYPKTPSSWRFEYHTKKEVQEDIQSHINYLDDLIERIVIIPSQQIKTTNNTKSDKISTNDIFIVHGHNTEIKELVATTIRKLKLNPIVLNEKANQGRTILEKFENHSDVSFAIVLLTDDDEGKEKTQANLQKRARQNVVFEFGYFVGKLGRSKVLCLYTEGVETPSDINGFLYTKLDNSQAWRFEIVKELKAAGYSVSADDLLEK